MNRIVRQLQSAIEAEREVHSAAYAGGNLASRIDAADCAGDAEDATNTEVAAVAAELDDLQRARDELAARCRNQELSIRELLKRKASQS